MSNCIIDEFIEHILIAAKYVEGRIKKVDHTTNDGKVEVIRLTTKLEAYASILKYFVDKKQAGYTCGKS